MHEIHLFDERLAQGLGDRLVSSIFHEPPADLIAYLLTQLLNPVGGVLGENAPPQIVQSIRLTGQQGLEQPFFECVYIELPEGPVQVVGAADRPSRLHPRQSLNGIACGTSQHVGVHLEKRVEERLEELFQVRSRRPTGAFGPVPRANRLVPVAGRRFRPADGEVDVESGVERRLMAAVLDHRRPQGLAKRLPVCEIDEPQRLHTVDGFDHGDRYPRPAELLHEAGEQSEHPQPGAGGEADSSLSARSMSVWYLSSTWSVSPTTSVSMCSTPRASSVRAQSIVSETDGDFFKSMFRIDRATRAISLASSSGSSGTLARRMFFSRSGVG